MPRFTIVVPTRNRPAELTLTLETLKRLEKADFSILVSDNSDPAIVDRNRATVEATLEGLSFSYIRPPKSMNMVDHWNFAVSAAEGDYVGIVTDRLTLVPSTMALVDEVIARTGANCVCYTHTTFDAASGRLLKPHAGIVPAIPMRTGDVLAQFASAQLVMNSPRFLNSFCSRRVLEAIAKRHGQVFGGIAPDYSFNFRLLSTIDEYVLLDAPLLVDHSPLSSNGMAVTHNRNNSASQDFWARMKVEQRQFLEFGPIPHEGRLLPNIILREMEICRAEAGQFANIPAVNPQRFYRACLKFFRRLARLSDSATEETSRLIEQYRRDHALGRPGLVISARTHFGRIKNTIRHQLAQPTAPAAGATGAADSKALMAALTDTPSPVTVEFHPSITNISQPL